MRFDSKLMFHSMLCVYSVCVQRVCTACTATHRSVNAHWTLHWTANDANRHGSQVG